LSLVNVEKSYARQKNFR